MRSTEMWRRKCIGHRNTLHDHMLMQLLGQLFGVSKHMEPMLHQEQQRALADSTILYPQTSAVLLPTLLQLPVLFLQNSTPVYQYWHILRSCNVDNPFEPPRKDMNQNWQGQDLLVGQHEHDTTAPLHDHSSNKDHRSYLSRHNRSQPDNTFINCWATTNWITQSKYWIWR